ncbi:MAG: C69 family dipeptidase, partial [Eubacteriales bacterium]|nr:C69 family dipeptidase [Eubacteriales bacterium]
MACTTILIGRKASYDGSTIVARNEDSCAGKFDPKRFAVMTAAEQPVLYKSVLSHVEIPLPKNPMQYTYMPNNDPSEGIWGAFGVNEKNVSMTATETITSNALVLGADPLVVYKEGDGHTQEQPGGIGEEDIVTITLPYITSARDGVKRLGMLLETYGTYEMNGIAFQDEEEIWWLETIGGHNWIAKRVPDDTYVVMPNQLGIDFFDFEDAYGEQREHMCSSTLKALVEENYLDRRMNPEEVFNPRDAFGSHDDGDHIYNTPRAWAMRRYFNPRSFVWDGPNADFGPESDDLPWAFVPEKKITLDEVKWALSNHYQGTPYDVYGKSFD